MKKIHILMLSVMLIACSDANAWFFFFIPASVTRGVADAVTGAKGNICVKDNAKVGDVIPSVAGNTMKVTSLSGTSSMCAAPGLPIRADVEYTFSFKSNAGINMSDDYEAKPLNDFQRYSGYLLQATSKSTRNKGVVINAREKKANASPEEISNAVEKGVIAALVDASSRNAEQFKIGETNAWRFEVQGKTKGVFGTSIVYIVTILEGDNEILVINAYAPADNIEKNRDELRKFALDVTGLTLTKTKQNVTNIAIQNKNEEKTVTTENLSNESLQQSSSVSIKMRELSKLLSEGLITKDDYESKKAELLKSL